MTKAATEFRRLAKRNRRQSATKAHMGENAPTPEFQARHAVTAPLIDRNYRREAWQISTRLMALFEGKKITRQVVDAARRYHDDYDIGVIGISDRDPTGTKVDGGGNHDRMTELRMNCLSRFREANKFVARELGSRLGYQAQMLLLNCIVLDKAWSETARSLPRGAESEAGMSSDNTARARTIDALDYLLAFYDENDGANRQGSSRMRSAYGEEKNIAPD